MIWFTADWHLNHKNIIKYCRRPFDCVDHMNDTIINNTNELVGPTDELYFLGDFLLGPKEVYIDNARRVLDRLKCKNITFILGNHDRKIIYEVFEKHHQKLIIKEPVKILLTHRYCPGWDKIIGDDGFHFFGHSHGNLSGLPNSCRDVGVDTNNFYPYSLQELTQ